MNLKSPNILSHNSTFVDCAYKTKNRVNVRDFAQRDRKIKHYNIYNGKLIDIYGGRVYNYMKSIFGVDNMPAKNGNKNKSGDKNAMNAKVITISLVVMFAVVFAAAFFITSAVTNPKVEPSSKESSSAEPAAAPVKAGTTAEKTTAAPETTAQTTAQPTTQKQVQTTAAQKVSSSGIKLLTEPQMITYPTDEAQWKLVLLNTYYRVLDNVDQQIKFAPAIKGSDEVLDYRAAEAYQKMYDAGKADGVTLTPVSGYRSYSLQKRLYNNLVDEYLADGYSQAESEALASTRRMPPGSSEHNIGIAMDIGWVDSRFANSAEYAWLCKNAADYGFILRYTEENKKYTGVKAEPWHWRYVGVENAGKIKASGLSLEEYLGKVN